MKLLTRLLPLLALTSIVNGSGRSLDFSIVSNFTLPSEKELFKMHLIDVNESLTPMNFTKCEVPTDPIFNKLLFFCVNLSITKEKNHGLDQIDIQLYTALGKYYNTDYINYEFEENRSTYD
jgi:hypothetical protein